MYETRNELKKIIEKLHKDLNSCEVALERTRTDQEEFQEAEKAMTSDRFKEAVLQDLISEKEADVLKKADTPEAERLEERLKITQLNQRLDSEILSVSEDVIKNTKKLESLHDLIGRIDVLEDLVCTICHLVKGPNDYLKNKAKEIYDKQADRGGSNG